MASVAPGGPWLIDTRQRIPAGTDAPVPVPNSTEYMGTAVSTAHWQYIRIPMYWDRVLSLLHGSRVPIGMARLVDEWQPTNSKHSVFHVRVFRFSFRVVSSPYPRPPRTGKSSRLASTRTYLQNRTLKAVVLRTLLFIPSSLMSGKQQPARPPGYRHRRRCVRASAQPAVCPIPAPMLVDHGGRCWCTTARVPVPSGTGQRGGCKRLSRLNGRADAAVPGGTRRSRTRSSRLLGSTESGAE